ncbi:MAG: phosphatidylserine decarboxylase family protein [Magnetococcales bacterium]|nr:phosphatidylserine decarboxylase family protein [Magnetococcales bacterium]MBF0270817.1 phosphatidylserine decarboxylase family protein [Magnetococcales bacterium]
MAMRSPVAKEGLPFIGIFVLVALAGTAWLPYRPLQAVLWILAGWCVWFFRDPERQTPSGDGLVIAPADGKVVAIEETIAPLSGLPARKFSIFMNVFSVHVNRFPIAGRVEQVAYHPGKFLNAALDKASVENERMEVCVVTAAGERISFVQVAGLVARRIVCYLKPGDAMPAGQRFGLIRFGSRVDVYLPLSARIEPVLGDQTRAGETVIARL